ncbi:MAG: TolC family protein [bacterium]
MNKKGCELRVMKKRQLLFISTIISLCLQTQGIAGGSTSSLSFYIQTALENNLDIKSEHLSLSKEEISLNRAKKEVFYPEIGTAVVVGGNNKKTDWIKDEEGIERKQITAAKEKPSVEIDSAISRPHPFGGKISLNLKAIEGLSTGSQDVWEARVESEELLSKSARQIIKTPLFDEQLQLDTAKLNLQERINETISEVINSYTQLQRLDFTLVIRHKELEDLQGNIEISRLKLEKGLIPEMDIFQMELQGSSVLSEMETIKKDKRGQMARFLQILGEDVLTQRRGELQPTVEDLLTRRRGERGEIQSTVEDVQDSRELLDRIKVLKGFVGSCPQLSGTQSVMSIPQVKIKYIQLELSKRRLQEAVSKNAPVLTPAFTVNRSGNTTNEEFRASVKFPLYDKGIKKEEVKLAQASLSQSEIELKNLIINTQIDIAATLDEIKDTERRIGVIDKEIGLSEKIYGIAMIKHSRGLISAKDMLEYQSDVFCKRKSIFDEQTELFLDYVKLLKATGELYRVYQENIL